MIRALLVLVLLGATLGAVTPTPCPTEDSANCVWNAARQGNGIGRSFVDLAGLVIAL